MLHFDTKNLNFKFSVVLVISSSYIRGFFFICMITEIIFTLCVLCPTVAACRRNDLWVLPPIGVLLTPQPPPRLPSVQTTCSSGCS